MRKYYLDNIRIMTVILVVIYHVIYMYNGVLPVLGAFNESGVQYQDAFQYVVYPWFMVLLFIVSGVSARLSLEHKSRKEFLKARTLKLLVPSTIGLFVFQWIQGYYNMKIANAFETMPLNAMPKTIALGIMAVSGTGVLWYIQLLWLYSLLTVFVRKLEDKHACMEGCAIDNGKDDIKSSAKGGRLYRFGEKANMAVMLLLGIVVWLGAQVLNAPFICVYRVGIYAVCYFLGYFVFCHEKVIEKLEKNAVWLTVAAVILGTAEVIVYFGQEYVVAPVVNSPLSIAYAWVSCLAIFGLGKRYMNKSNKCMAWLNRKSFGIYVFHYLALSIFAYGGHASGLFEQMPVVLIYLLSGIISFGGAILIYEVISRIPLLRWAVLGIKKERKNV